MTRCQTENPNPARLRPRPVRSGSWRGARSRRIPMNWPADPRGVAQPVGSRTPLRPYAERHRRTRLGSRRLLRSHRLAAHSHHDCRLDHARRQTRQPAPLRPGKPVTAGSSSTVRRAASRSRSRAGRSPRCRSRLTKCLVPVHGPGVESTARRVNGELEPSRASTRSSSGRCNFE